MPCLFFFSDDPIDRVEDNRDGIASSPRLVLVAQLPEPSGLAAARVVVRLASSVSAGSRARRSLRRESSNFTVIPLEARRTAAHVVALALSSVHARDEAFR